MTNVVEDFAQKVDKRWTHRDIECAIVFHPTGCFKNGYVKVPESVVLPDDDCPDFDVHGGITWGPDAGRWIGFDTAHAGDFWPDLPGLGGMFLGGDEMFSTEWTDEMLVAEVERLADQVAEAV